MMAAVLTWRAIARNPARRFCICRGGRHRWRIFVREREADPYILPAVPPLAVLIADDSRVCAWPAESREPRRARRTPEYTIETGPMLSMLGAGRSLRRSRPAIRTRT